MRHVGPGRVSVLWHVILQANAKTMLLRGINCGRSRIKSVPGTTVKVAFVCVVVQLNIVVEECREMSMRASVWVSFLMAGVRSAHACMLTNLPLHTYLHFY